MTHLRSILAELVDGALLSNRNAVKANKATYGVTVSIPLDWIDRAEAALCASDEPEAVCSHCQQPHLSADCHYVAERRKRDAARYRYLRTEEGGGRMVVNGELLVGSKLDARIDAELSKDGLAELMASADQAFRDESGDSLLGGADVIPAVRTNDGQ